MTSNWLSGEQEILPDPIGLLVAKPNKDSDSLFDKASQLYNQV
jgi:hypothetical protein